MCVPISGVWCARAVDSLRDPHSAAETSGGHLQANAGEQSLSGVCTAHAAAAGVQCLQMRGLLFAIVPSGGLGAAPGGMWHPGGPAPHKATHGDHAADDSTGLEMILPLIAPPHPTLHTDSGGWGSLRSLQILERRRQAAVSKDIPAGSGLRMEEFMCLESRECWLFSGGTILVPGRMRPSTACLTSIHWWVFVDSFFFSLVLGGGGGGGPTLCASRSARAPLREGGGVRAVGNTRPGCAAKRERGPTRGSGWYY